MAQTQGSVTLYVGGVDAYSISNADSSTPGKLVSLGGHVDRHALVIDPVLKAVDKTGYTVLDGSDGGMWEFYPTHAASHDLNVTMGSNPTLQLTQIYGITANPNDPRQIIAGAQDNGTFQTLGTPGNLTWTSTSAGDGGLIFYDPNTNTAYANAGTADLFANTNPYTSGFQFNNSIDPPNNPPQPDTIGNHPIFAYFVEPVDVNGTYHDYIWYGGQDGNFPDNNALWLSTNGGVSWDEIGSPTVASPTWPSVQTTAQTGSCSTITRWTPSRVPVTGNATHGLSEHCVRYPAWRQGAGIDQQPEFQRHAKHVGRRLPGHLDHYEPGPDSGSDHSAERCRHKHHHRPARRQAGFPSSGNLFVETATRTWTLLTYSGISNGNVFTGVSSYSGSAFSSLIAAGDTVGYQNDLKFSSLEIDPSNPDVVYMTAANFGSFTGGGHVFMGVYNGSTVTWTNISGSSTNPSDNLPNLPVWSIQVADNPGNAPTLFVGTDLGVYVSSNGGATWSPFGSGLPNVQVRSMDLITNQADPSQNQLLVGTFGNGAYKISLDNVTVGPLQGQLAAAALDSPYNPSGSQTVTGGGVFTTYSFIATGSLPPGMTLSSTGVLSGTPMQAGPFTFTVWATDPAGDTGSQIYTLTVNPAITIGPAPVPAVASVSITSGGNGYTSVPTVTFQRPFGHHGQRDRRHQQRQRDRGEHNQPRHRLYHGADRHVYRRRRNFASNRHCRRHLHRRLSAHHRDYGKHLFAATDGPGRHRRLYLCGYDRWFPVYVGGADPQSGDRLDQQR